MAEVDDGTIEEIVHRGETMRLRNKLDVIERSHDGPGVTRETLSAYAQALADRRDYAFDPDAFFAEIEERCTDEGDWSGPEYFYVIDEERISQYPARWHDRLGDETDPVPYLRFFEDTSGSEADEDGIAQDVLLDLMLVIGGMNRDEAATAIEAARDRDHIVKDADQHPRARVSLAEGTDEE